MFKHIIRVALILAGMAAASLATNEARAAEYTLLPSPQTVHIGFFSAAQKPVLMINSGDTVTIESALQLDPVEIEAAGAVPPSLIPNSARAIFREVTDRGPGPHVLT